MSRKKNCIFSLLAVGAILTACSQMGSEASESTRSVSGTSESTRTVSGTSQKGPFVKGTEVTLYGMDETLHQTGSRYSTIIDNDQGKFSLQEIPLEERYAWLNANGYFIDEYTAKKSERTILLNSLVDLQNTDKVNINVLTHLSFNRILYLVDEGKSVEEAKRQAEREVLDVFGFSGEGESFEQLDILSGGEGDAKLLAISLIMRFKGNVGDVAEFMAWLALDLETDGVCDDTVLVRELKDIASMLAHKGVYEQIRWNIRKMGATEISDFRKYLIQFASSWDSTWDSCSNQNEVKNTLVLSERPYEPSSKAICRDGVWKYYNGIRVAGMSPVDTAGKYGTLVDERDGRVYKTLDVELDDGRVVTWMADLLEYEPKSSKGDYKYIPGVGREYSPCQILGRSDNGSCVELDSEMNDRIFGKEKIQGICPDGWHIPIDREWIELFDFISDGYRWEVAELLVLSQYVDPETDVSLGVNMYTVGFRDNYSISEREFPGYDYPREFVTHEFVIHGFGVDFTCRCTSSYIRIEETSDLYFERYQDQHFGLRCVKD
ncbi:MAG: hypothetical protein IK012_01035 [Fibrobacter sp.]|uniref:FISUMP domain-containing protein n=1 Tax=Fibrobacter sp. TaxID=35828 RepID=UPI0025B92282|nr:FISUMP domain-containing protein [Fibrobacter sp.]MBR4783827.1 hypothetical protein [Fibrobacter sp.]